MHQKQNFINPQLVYDRDEINCKHVAIVCGYTPPSLCSIWSKTPNTGFISSAHVSSHNVCLFVYEALVIFIGDPMAKCLRPLSSNNCGFQPDSGHILCLVVVFWAIFLFSPHLMVD